jgi:hypothetical protein
MCVPPVVRCSAREKVKEKVVSSGALRGFEAVGLGVFARVLLTGRPEGDVDHSSSSGVPSATAPQDATSLQDMAGHGAVEAKEEEVVPHASGGTVVSESGVTLSSSGLFGTEVSGAWCVWAAMWPWGRVLRSESSHPPHPIP